MSAVAARLQAGFVVILSALLLVGCWGYNEVNDLAFVAVAALDRRPEGGYRWTVAVPVPELVLPASVGGGGAGTAGGVTRTNLFRSATGPAPRAAAQALDAAIPREVRWSFADHILVGEAVARTGLLPLLEMISRGYRVERRASLYVVRGEAGELLTQLQPALDRSLARSFDALTRKNRPGTLRGVDGNTVLRWLDTPGTDPFLPVVTSAQASGAVSPAPGGIALFRRDRLAGFLSPPLDNGLLMARGEAHPFTMVVACPAGAGAAGAAAGTGRGAGAAVVSLQVDRNKARIRVVGSGTAASGAGAPASPGGGAMPRLQLQVDLAGVVLEWQCPDGRVDLERVRAVGQAAAQQARAQIRAALERSAALGVDPVGFGAALYRQDPRAWRAVQTQWRQRLRDLRPEVVVTFHVRGYQLTASAP